MAGREREDAIIENSNAKYDTGEVSGDVVTSDEEDKNQSIKYATPTLTKNCLKKKYSVPTME